MRDTNEISAVYHEGYQAGSVQPEILKAYAWIASVINAYFHVGKSHLDVGCGGGALVRAMLALGYDSMGVEGSEHAVDIMPDSIILGDLRDPSFSLDREFDIVTCFDVAEHIDHEHSSTLCDFFDTHVRARGVLIFGAAGEGQDGLGHVNCQHPCYWINLLKHGFRLNAWESELIRNAIKANNVHSSAWWVARNLMVFRKKLQRSEYAGPLLCSDTDIQRIVQAAKARGKYRHTRLERSE